MNTALTTPTALPTPALLDIGIGGMTCSHCEKAVTRALKQLDPQAQVTIDRSANRVDVQSDQARTLLSQAMTDEGYTVAA